MHTWKTALERAGGDALRGCWIFAASAAAGGTGGRPAGSARPDDAAGTGIGNRAAAPAAAAGLRALFGALPRHVFAAFSGRGFLLAAILRTAYRRFALHIAASAAASTAAVPAGAPPAAAAMIGRQHQGGGGKGIDAHVYHLLQYKLCGPEAGGSENSRRLTSGGKAATMTAAEPRNPR